MNKTKIITITERGERFSVAVCANQFQEGGCAVSYDRQGGVKDILLCDHHAAADALLEAAEAVFAAEQGSRTFTPAQQAAWERFSAALDAARKAAGA